jgi:hypothetical protein
MDSRRRQEPPTYHHPILRKAAVILALFAFPQPSIAHDHWISHYNFHDPNSGALCCDEHDCSALNENEVSEIPDGFLVSGIYFVARKRVLPSFDSHYWACFNSEGVGAHDRKKDVRCFFVPISTS